MKVHESVRIIADGAFARCTSLTDIVLSEGLIALERNSFQNCTSLTSVSLPSTVQGLSGFEGCTALTEVELNQGLISISANAFLSCLNLSSINFGQSTVEGISERAFSDCIALVEVILPERLRILGFGAFAGCRSLERVSVPSTLETIPGGVFENCSSLVDVYLSEGLLKSIERRAFANCTSIAAIALPKSIQRIGSEAFVGCVSLLGVQLPSMASGLFIEGRAFASCSSLVNIRTPQGGRVHKARDFSGCVLLCSRDWDRGLEERFADLPVHDACYQSSHFRIDDLAKTIDLCTQEELVDMFGMTPFHVLATSSKLSVRLFEVLMNKYPLKVVLQTDYHGNTMMDYLVKNRAFNANTLFQLALQRAVIERMDDCGLGPYRSTFSTFVKSRSNDVDADSRLQAWEEVKDRFSSNVKTEMSLIVELSVWKRNISLFSGDRAGCRSMGGSMVVPSSVIPFLLDNATRIGFDFKDIR